MVITNVQRSVVLKWGNIFGRSKSVLVFSNVYFKDKFTVAYFGSVVLTFYVTKDLILLETCSYIVVKCCL